MKKTHKINTNTGQYNFTEPDKPLKDVKSKGFIGSIMTYRPIDNDVRANYRLYDLEKMYYGESFTNPDLAAQIGANPEAIKKAIVSYDKIVLGIKALTSDLIASTSYLNDTLVGKLIKIIRSMSLQIDQINEEIEKLTPNKDLLPQNNVRQILELVEEFHDTVVRIHVTVDRRDYIFDEMDNANEILSFIN